MLGIGSMVSGTWCASIDKKSKVNEPGKHDLYLILVLVHWKKMREKQLEKREKMIKAQKQ